MILELSVENIAVIERAQITLGPGFTVLTGETGAGKSLLVDAIALALGGRADQDLLRAGAQKGPVNLVADISDNPAAQALCQELGIPVEDGQVFVQREITSEGRNVSRIGGKAQPVSAVRQLGALLVDLHGQHDHQALLDPERHQEYLDLWIGEPAEQLKMQVRVAFADVDQRRQELATLRQGMRHREQRLDLLRFQDQEIEAVNPMVGESAELEQQLSRLQHAERLTESAFSGLTILSDEEGAAEERLGSAIASLEQVVKLDSSLEATLEVLRTALATLQEGTTDLRRYAEGLESDPAALEETAARLDSIRRLVRKYGVSEESVLEFHQKVKEELALLEDAENSEEGLTAKLAESEARLRQVAGELTALRSERAIEFSALVQAQVRELAMDKALFAVDLAPKEPGEDGGDDIHFLFSANPGEPPRALARIASGGEMSRVMLAMKVVLAGKAGVPTLIFDEIDTGLSGRAAAVVAKKLQALGQFYQVVSISHLPQLAGRADAHFKIEKVEREGRTFTEIRCLGETERVEEVARMLAGEEIGEMAMANARELLAGRR